ncbi:MAG TPA: hypothetical protein VN969_35595 [Streptosporangiaceae bacterium]|nr:hypothetical protein [Streptosporangiaceae bacterium]
MGLKRARHCGSGTRPGSTLSRPSIWDNNYPKVTRRVQVNTKANTWSYNLSTSPDVPSSQWEGDASTKTMELTPAAAGLGAHPWPYDLRDSTLSKGQIGAAPPKGGSPAEVFLDGGLTSHGHLLLTDDAGQHTGYLDGKLVNQIPGATIQQNMLDNWQNSEEPDYFIPAGTHFTVTIEGEGLTATDDTSVGVIGDAYDLTVDGIQLHPGGQQTIDPAADGSSISYSFTGAQSPVISLGASCPGSYYIFTINAVVHGPSTITAQLPLDTGQFSLSEPAQSSPGDYTVTAEREDEHGVRSDQLPGLTLQPGDTAALDYTSWDQGGAMSPFIIASQNQATPQATTAG